MRLKTLYLFVSNYQRVFDELDEARGDINDVNLELDSKGTEKILGLRWSKKTDTFVFGLRFDLNKDVVSLLPYDIEGGLKKYNQSHK